MISNMYPSEQRPFFGIFVKRVFEGLSNLGVDIAITKATYSRNKFYRMLSYICFYFMQLLNSFKSYDICYIHFPKRCSIVPVVISRLLKRKVILNFHGSDLSGNRIDKMKTQFFLNKADLVILPSDSVEKRLKKNFFVKTPVFISPSGGVPDYFYNDIVYNYDGSIGYVSHIIRSKGWVELVKAYDTIKYPLELYGTGNDEVELKDKIETNIYIEYKGYIDHNILPDVYKSFSLFVFPSHTETLGLVGLEAMASGIPVIGSRIDGISGYIEDGVNGYLFEKGNVDNLQYVINQFLSLSDDKKLEMSKNARITAERYRTEIVIENLYNRLRNI